MIQIRPPDLSNIIAHCQEEGPIEACGILAGQTRNKVKEVKKVYRCTNELKSHREYRIEANEQFKIFKEIDKFGLNLLGFYHSHPDASSRPSPNDEARANYVGCSYIIIALHPIEVSSWILEKKGVFKEENIQKV